VAGIHIMVFSNEYTINKYLCYRDQDWRPAWSCQWVTLPQCRPLLTFWSELTSNTSGMVSCIALETGSSMQLQPIVRLALPTLFVGVVEKIIQSSLLSSSKMGQAHPLLSPSAPVMKE
jgi:hypothetical protein